MLKRDLHTSLATFILTLTVFFALPLPATGQSGPVPFDCTGEAFLVHNVDAELYIVDQSTWPFILVPVDDLNGNLACDPGEGCRLTIDDQPIEVNNLGFRKQDGLLYAAHLNPYGNNGLVKIDSNGNVFPLGSPKGLPSNLRFGAGGISPDGNTMFLLDILGNGSLYKIPLPGLNSVTIVPTSGASGKVADWAFHPVDGLLYGGDHTHGEIATVDPSTGNRTRSALVDVGWGTLPTGTAFGAAWFDVDGRFFLYHNDGTIFEIDLLEPAVVGLQSLSASARNDGTACTTACAPSDEAVSRTCDPNTLVYASGQFNCFAPSDSSDGVTVTYASSTAISELGIYFYEQASEPVAVTSPQPRVGSKSTLRYLAADGSELGRRESTLFSDGTRHEFLSFSDITLIDATLQQERPRQCASDGPAANVQLLGTVLGQEVDVDFETAGPSDLASLVLALSTDPPSQELQTYNLIGRIEAPDLPTVPISHFPSDWSWRCYAKCIPRCLWNPFNDVDECHDNCYSECYGSSF